MSLISRVVVVCLMSPAFCLADLWWWPPECVISPDEPVEDVPVAITVSGEWPNTCVPNDRQLIIDGQTITFEVILDYPPDIICFAMITSWSSTLNAGPLSAGTYQVEVALYDTVTGLVEAPQPVCSISVGAKPHLIRAMSRKKHGPAGTLDIEIPSSSATVIDSRAGVSKPQLLLTYDSAPNDPGCEGLTIVNGTCINTNVSGNDLIIDMALLQNACVEVSVGDDTLRLLTHIGNVNGDSAVNVIDLQEIKNHIFEAVEADTCAYDINCDGAIDVIDLQTAKNNMFTSVRCE